MRSLILGAVASSPLLALALGCAKSEKPATPEQAETRRQESIRRAERMQEDIKNNK